MTNSRLIPCEDNYNPFCFFEDEKPSIPENGRFKIYHDGSHYVATLSCYRRSGKKQYRSKRKDYDMLFQNLYANALRFRYNRSETTGYIRENMIKLFPDFECLDEYIEKHLKMSLHNLYARKKRFRRKGYLNKWNYFVTFTYDDKKHSAETFRQKIRKCLSNLHTRRGWRYMGVFEQAPETGRLHFHGLLYVPDGEMIGSIIEETEYSTAQHCMQTIHSNSFFSESFGRNDFDEITSAELKYGHTIDYIMKYIGKTNERIVYSRGIPTEVCKDLTDTEIITSFTDYVTKYVLFDNAVSWEKDIMHSTGYKQISIIDIICNPPLSA